MVWIDTSLRRILCSEEVKRAWGLLQESGKALAAQHWLYNLDLCPATNPSHDLHRMFCHFFIVDCDGVRVLFELDDRFGAERLADAFDDFFHFRLRSLLVASSSVLIVPCSKASSGMMFSLVPECTTP